MRSKSCLIIAFKIIAQIHTGQTNLIAGKEKVHLISVIFTHHQICEQDFMENRIERLEASSLYTQINIHATHAKTRRIEAYLSLFLFLAHDLQRPYTSIENIN